MYIVITGASRGIGLELSRQALEQGDHVLAVARKPEESKGLQALKSKFTQTLTTLAVDVTDASAGERLQTAVNTWPSVDVLINNAGIYRKGESLSDFQDSFHTNSIVPFFITRALTSKLRSGTRPRVIQITSLMGSISDNASGGSYAYRASKTALNMINKCLAVENAWLTTIVMHPGWVKTDMGGSEAPVEARHSAEGIWKVVRELKSTDSGKFFDFQGKALSW